MAYNPNIPQANDLLSQSQTDIQGNFAEIQTLVGINHINFGNASQGKHLYLQIPEHAAPITAIDEAGLYANVGIGSGVTELFFRRENNGPSIGFTEITSNITGWTRLPSGLILKWGTGTVGANASDTVVFDATLPFTTVFNVQVSMQGQAGRTGTLYYTSFTTTQLTVYRTTTNSTAIGYNYFVIGV